MQLGRGSDNSLVEVQPAAPGEVERVPLGIRHLVYSAPAPKRQNTGSAHIIDVQAKKASVVRFRTVAPASCEIRTPAQ